jgi:hypothetical protein
VATFLFLGLLALKLETPASANLSDSRIGDLSGQVNSLKNAINRLAATQAQTFWQPLSNEEKNAIAAAMKAMGTRRVEIWRNPVTDCEALADEFAGIAQSRADWNLLQPPYDPMGSEGTGIVLLTNEEGSKVADLENAIKGVVHSEVGKEPLPDNATGPDGQPVDIVIFIGVRRTSSFVREGDERIAQGQTNTTIRADVSPPYSVSGYTNWGTKFTVLKTAQGYFIINFSTAAPPKSASFTPTFHWQTYRYQ